MTLSKLERAVLDEFSREATRKGLLPPDEQFEPTVTNRESTGVGWWVWFEAAVPASGERERLSEVEIEFPDEEVLAGAVLVLDDGRPIELELFTYDEPWPNVDARFVVRRLDD